MKNIAVIIFLGLFPLTMYGQKFMTQTGKISFFSKAPLENIEAVNNQVSGVINAATGEMAFSLLMKGFTFDKALMQEHFNEKYVESDKFPKSNFKGSIEDMDKVKLSKIPVEVNITGQLTIHGVTKDIKVVGYLSQPDGRTISGSSEFRISLKDFNIKIPSAVRENIAETIDISVKLNYEKLD